VGTSGMLDDRVSPGLGQQPQGSRFVMRDKASGWPRKATCNVPCDHIVDGLARAAIGTCFNAGCRLPREPFSSTC